MSADPQTEHEDDTTDVLSALEAISPSMLPCVLRLTNGCRLHALRRKGPLWIIDTEIGEVAIRSETLIDQFEDREPWSERGTHGDSFDPALPERAPTDVPADNESSTPATPEISAEPQREAEASQTEPAQPSEPPSVAPVSDTAHDDPESTVKPVVPSRNLLRQIAGRMFLSRRSSMMVQLSIAALISNILGFALPLFTMAVYDRVIPHNAQATLIALTTGIAVIFLIDLVLRMVRARLQEAVGIGVNMELQAALYARYIRSEMSSVPRGSGPLTAAFQAVEGLAMTMPALLVGLLIDLPFVLITLLYIAHIGGIVVASPVVVIGLIVLIGCIAHIASRAPTRIGAAFSAQRLGMIDETAAAMEQVKAASAAPLFDRIWLRLVDGASYHGHRTRMCGAYAQQSTVVLAQAATVGCIVLGAGQIAEGAMTVGALVAVSILVGRTIQPITAVIAGGLRLASISESADAAKRIAETPEEVAGDTTAAGRSISGAIALNGASFTYPGAATPSLRNVTVKIEKGERVAIIGKIGCGKSTFARMIPRLYTLQDGAIYLDERDIRQFEAADLRNQIGYMSQDFDLFEDTVFENVCVGLDTVSDERFSMAVHASGLHDFISTRPDGYGLKVGPRGRNLSGGERQAVSLARVLMRDTPIMVLDEPTAAMDNQLERTLIRRLKPLVEGKTLILCTHRAPALALVDRVIWLENGSVVADGPPKDVLGKLSAAGGKQ